MCGRTRTVHCHIFPCTVCCNIAQVDSVATPKMYPRRLLFKVSCGSNGHLASCTAKRANSRGWHGVPKSPNVSASAVRDSKVYRTRHDDDGIGALEGFECSMFDDLYRMKGSLCATCPKINIDTLRLAADSSHEKEQAHLHSYNTPNTGSRSRCDIFTVGHRPCVSPVHQTMYFQEVRGEPPQSGHPKWDA